MHAQSIEVRVRDLMEAASERGLSRALVGLKAVAPIMTGDDLEAGADREANSRKERITKANAVDVRLARSSSMA
jgi:hypothetical protein